MKVAVRSAHAMYLKQIEEKKAEESKKQSESRQEEARKRNNQEMPSERRTIEEKEKSLNEAEKEAVNDIDAANKLSSDGTTKLANCFGQKMWANFDTGQAAQLAHLPCLCL